MPLRDLEADFFVRQCPTIEFADGVFEVAYDVGNAHFRFIMPPSVYCQALLVAEGARAKWQLSTMDGGNVTNIRR